MNLVYSGLLILKVIQMGLLYLFKLKIGLFKNAI